MPAAPRSRTTVLALAGLALVAVAGCSSTEPKTTEQPYTQSGPGAKVAAVPSPAGLVLADGDGRILYARIADGGADPAPCTGDCAAQWTAYPADGVPTPADGALNPLRPNLLSTTTGPAGGTQVTYAGHALFRFAGDPRPGTVAGQGVQAFGGTWYPLSPNGDPVPRQNPTR